MIGPFFFENEQEVAVTVNGDRYRTMLNDFLFTKIEEEKIGNIWFQQDGATCHTAEATLDVLHPVFEDRIISLKADEVWPPRSCDLIPMGYYLWGAVKDKCHADKPEQINALKDNVHKVLSPKYRNKRAIIPYHNHHLSRNIKLTFIDFFCLPKETWYIVFENG